VAFRKVFESSPKFVSAIHFAGLKVRAHCGCTFADEPNLFSAYDNAMNVNVHSQPVLSTLCEGCRRKYSNSPQVLRE
jgi:hypothetical protein